jgi:hypothetical protein
MIFDDAEDVIGIELATGLKGELDVGVAQIAGMTAKNRFFFSAPELTTKLADITLQCEVGSVG